MGLAALIALLGFALVCLSAWLFLPGSPRLPVLSAGDWPVLITMFLGAGWSLLGTVQFMRHGRGALAKLGLGLLLVGSLGITVLTSVWVLDLSYQVPAAPDLKNKPLPAFELVDQNGTTHTDQSLRGTPTVLIFGRGVW
jgi:hypothetical protein